MHENKRKDRFTPIRALFSRQADLSRQTRRARHLLVLNVLESLENMWYFPRFLPVQHQNLRAQNG